MQLYTVYFICKLLYIFRTVFPPIIRNTNNYLQHLVLVNRCCYLPLSRLIIVICAPDGWKTHRKHVEQLTDKIKCV